MRNMSLRGIDSFQKFMVSLKKLGGKSAVFKMPGLISNMKENYDGQVGMHGLRVYL
jgi:hypothetical protein